MLLSFSGHETTLFLVLTFVNLWNFFVGFYGLMGSYVYMHIFTYAKTYSYNVRKGDEEPSEMNIGTHVS